MLAGMLVRVGLSHRVPDAPSCFSSGGCADEGRSMGAARPAIAPQCTIHIQVAAPIPSAGKDTAGGNLRVCGWIPVGKSNIVVGGSRLKNAPLAAEMMGTAQHLQCPQHQRATRRGPHGQRRAICRGPGTCQQATHRRQGTPSPPPCSLPHPSGAFTRV